MHTCVKTYTYFIYAGGLDWMHSLRLSLRDARAPVWFSTASVHNAFRALRLRHHRHLGGGVYHRAELGTPLSCAELHGCAVLCCEKTLSSESLLCCLVLSSMAVLVHVKIPKQSIKSLCTCACCHRCSCTYVRIYACMYMHMYYAYTPLSPRGNVEKGTHTRPATCMHVYV